MDSLDMRFIISVAPAMSSGKNARRDSTAGLRMLASMQLDCFLPYTLDCDKFKSRLHIASPIEV